MAIIRSPFWGEENFVKLLGRVCLPEYLSGTYMIASHGRLYTIN